MVYTLRCILDAEEDVIRDISIRNTSSLQDLHQAIVNYFELPTGELASFYKTTHTWEQGEEIPLVDMSDAGKTSEMKDFTLASLLKKEQDKLLYVYDFLNLWTFFISLQAIHKDVTLHKTGLQFSLGTLPNEAPGKIFTSEKILDDFEDEFNSEFDDSLDIDDALDNYY